MSEQRYPGTAIGVVIFNEDNKVLLGRRKGELGPGQYSVPGGKIDFGETPYQTAIREVKEETNLNLKNLQFTGDVTNDYFPEKDKHFICMYYTADVANPEELKIMEPTKIEGWDWYDPNNLPEPTWMHTAQLIRAVATGDKLATTDIDGYTIE